MWRAFFLAAGASCCLLGVQCLAIDKAILSKREPTQARFLGMGIPATATERNKELTPPDWAPWSRSPFPTVGNRQAGLATVATPLRGGGQERAGDGGPNVDPE
jgi:hypothetical protein